MKYMKSKLGQKGFTLIELMIVVGIIGILVAIAAPNFSRYQSKARQSEAKIALAAVYGSEKAFYSEYAAYVASMDAIGYSPEGARRFYSVGWTANHTTSPTGYTGSILNGIWTNVNNSFTCTTSTVVLPASLTGDAQTFTAGASGCVRNGAPAHDLWNITENKVLSNSTINL